MNNPPNSAYPAPLDAIVMAGTDSNPRRMIKDQNKAFLDVGGEVLVRRVVGALLGAESIGKIFVVGPHDRLSAVLGGLPPEVIIVEQSGRLVANAWAGIGASEAHYRKDHGSDDPLRPLFFISCDLPIISPAAVDDFVARCADEDIKSEAPFAILAGVAEEASLKGFYAEDGKDGIQRPYVNFRECRVRLANIYVARPRTLANQQFLETGFAHRKAEKLKNVIILAWKFLGQSGGWAAAWYTAKLQLTLVVSKKQGRLYQWLRGTNSTARAEQCVGNVLGGSVRIVITPYGGLSLDVDDEEDYRILSRRFEEWSAMAPVEPMPRSW